MRFILLPDFLDFHLLVSFKYHVVGTSNRFDVQEIYLEINRSMTDTISLLISGSESNECPFPAKSNRSVGTLHSSSRWNISNVDAW